jgi:hypothetical protein
MTTAPRPVRVPWRAIAAVACGPAWAAREAAEAHDRAGLELGLFDRRQYEL